MKVLKKIIIALVLAVMVFSVAAFAACGNNDEPSNDEPKTNIGSDTDSDKDTGGDASGSGSQSESSDDVIDSTKTVNKIEVKQNPNKTTYMIGEAVDLTGGILTVTY